MTEISIIIVTYHNEDTIKKCINSIFKKSSEKIEIIVVDNSENLLTINIIKSLNNDKIKIIKPKNNIGFAKGCNLGAKNAEGKYYMFLNPDTIFLNDICTILKKFIDENKKCGAVGPQFWDPINKTVEKTCRNLPNFYTLFLQSTGLEKFSNYYILKKFSHDEIKTVGQIIGACFFVRKDIFEKLNGFDERFFIYFEEVDFCKRLIDLGYKVYFNPFAKILHYKGSSCENIKFVKRMIVQFRISRTLYFEKHFGFWGKIISIFFNKIEGFIKGNIFLFLSLIKRDKYYFEKSKGYFKVLLYV